MNTYMDTLNTQIDRLFDEALGERGTSGDHWVPACNLREDDDGFYVQVALPGWEPNQVTLEVNEKMLTVRGERASGEETGPYLVREIPDGSFCRMFTLPASLDYEKARAVHSNGLLSISLPKREEARAKRILIEAA